LIGLGIFKKRGFIFMNDISQRNVDFIFDYLGRVVITNQHIFEEVNGAAETILALENNDDSSNRWNWFCPHHNPCHNKSC
jgi:hypothetical protein